MNNTSLSITGTASHKLNIGQKVGLTLAALGVLILFVAWAGVSLPNTASVLATSLLLMFAGTFVYTHQTYGQLPAGIKNNGVWFSSLMNKGVVGWIVGIILTGFYIILYFMPQYLGLGADGTANTGLVALFDPLSQFLKKQNASQWFVYGVLYTVCILALGVKFLIKYRHNRYQIFRTLSVMFFQLGFAFLLPEILMRLNYPYYNFANMWPLNYYFFDDWNIKGFLDAGGLGMLMLVFGLAMVFIISPILTYKYGKRWYCSWVCGCGGLAETAGDPFRHLSDKSLKAWKIERWMIHSILVFSIVMTVAVIYSFFHNNPNGFWVTKELFLGIVIFLLGGLAAIAKFKVKWFKTLDKKIVPWAIGILVAIILFTVLAYVTGSGKVFFIDSYSLRSSYGFAIGSAFSGVIGVGFYPLLGSRVWCRFGCPMAAILGIQQKFFSRFRITTNGGQCISCGNCSTYCEMGIDVRSYAQKGQDIVRASCVGCGICAAVCPRGVLRLENAAADVEDRTSDLRGIHIGADGIRLLD